MKLLTAASSTALAVTLAFSAGAGSAGTSADRVKTLTARSGAVTARVTYRDRDSVHSNVHVRIVRGGETVLAGPLRRVTCENCPTKGFLLVQEKGLSVRDLDADGEPEVLLELYTGGAHCCFFTLFFGYAAGHYARALQWWGNYAYMLKDLGADGQPEFVSHDDRFAYAFAPYVASVPPIQIWRFKLGELFDVTREFPAVVEKEARTLLAAYERNRRKKEWDQRGILAGYLAEMYLLGREDEGWRVLERAYARGDVGRTRVKDGYPAGRNYLKALRTFLRRTGYTR